jgi:hypothetical protein
MSREELLRECRILYDRAGIGCFNYSYLKQEKLYFALYSKGLKIVDVVQALGLHDEYKSYRANRSLEWRGREVGRWTWDRVLAKSREIAGREGSLPPAAWLQSNGHAALVVAVYKLGRTWADLRSALQDFSNSNFVESRNRIRWLSHAEASLSNFLYARGIEHRKGGKYPDGYAEQTGRSYGVYDLSFRATDGRWIDVEVWGDRPMGLEEAYQKKRRQKEAFNRDNPKFLGIGHRNCYSEDQLAAMLQPYIGTIEPFQFDRPVDALLHTTHWSNTDELLEFARHIADSMPDGRFPTEEWLRKRGRWAERPGDAYNTLAVYIKQWIGGIRKLRSLLDQQHLNTKVWTPEAAIAAYREFCERRKMTPDQARQRYMRKGKVDRAVYLEAAKIAAAVTKYAGGAKAVKEKLGLSLPRSRKWTREGVLAEIRKVISEYGLSPHQLLNDHRTGKRTLPGDTRLQLGQLIDAAGRLSGGVLAAMKEIGFESPSRHRTRRRFGGQGCQD